MSNILHPNESGFNELIANNLVLVDFYADWCGPCKMLGPVVEQLADAYEGKIKVVKINTDENPDLAIRYGVQSIPNLFVIKNNEVVNHAVGYMPYPKLEELIKEQL